jgi:uncharacterized protein (DUF2141 family)
MCAVMCTGGQRGDGRDPVRVEPPGAATATTAPVTRPAGAPLSVTIKDLRNRKGRLIFGVFEQADGFPNVEKKAVYWEVRDADAADLTFTARIPPGRYAASVLHDENRSGEMNRGIGGLPLEGYGVTNNPKPKLRAATFKEATFTLPAEGKELAISLQYQFL